MDTRHAMQAEELDAYLTAIQSGEEALPPNLPAAETELLDDLLALSAEQALDSAEMIGMENRLRAAARRRQNTRSSSKQRGTLMNKRIVFLGAGALALAAIALIIWGIVGNARTPAGPGPVADLTDTPSTEASATPAESAGPTSSAPTKVPTKTPGPSPTPLPPLPPQIVDRSPARGEESPVDAPLMVRFDQPMDKSSVENSFTIEPTVKGTFEWADDRTLLFRPSGKLDRQAHYDVTIGESAISAAGLAAELPYSFRFQTVGFLEVSQVLPADTTTDVDVDTSLTIMFNRPVVPLVHSSEIGELPDPLQIEPAVEGTGEWLNTSIYVFRPATTLAAGTRYQVTVPAGLEDLTGGVLAEDYQWSFETQGPQITWYEPVDVAPDVGLTDSISITFNQPMDHSSVEAAFSIAAEDGPTPPGRYSWNDDSTEFAWTPAGELQMATRYYWSLDATARAAAGEATLEEGLSAQFVTVDYPALMFTSPRDGEQQADPYGGLDLYFASPMDPATIMPNLTIIPEPTSVYTWYDQWDDRFYVGYDKQASTDYQVVVGADMADPYGNTLGEETVVEFTTDQLDPMAYLNTPGRVGTYNSYTDTVVYAAYRNVSELDMSLWSLGSRDAIRLTGPDGWSLWDSFHPEADNLLREWTVTVENVLNETSIWRIRLTGANGDSLEPGIYYVTMTSPGFADYQESKHILIVSPINLTVKGAADEVLVWATDLASGQPVADLALTIYDGGANQITSGTTDAEGLLTASHAVDNYELFVMAGGSGDDDFSLGSSAWTDGISSWDFDLSSENYAALQTKVYLYTDRPIYRPGHVIHFKGILREPDEARYQLPPMTEIAIEAYDWEDTLIYQETLPVSEMGTFAGDIHLDEAARTGNYHFLIDPDGLRWWEYFQVAEYRKPQFQVEVTPAKDQVVVGDQVQAEVASTYFFGGAVDGAEVEWAVYADDYSFDGPGRYSYQDFQDWYNYRWDNSYSYGYGNMVAEGQGVTDSSGHFTIELPAEQGDETGARLWTLEATVIDINEQRVTGRAEVVMHPAAQYAGIYAERYVGLAGEEQPVNLIVVDLDGEPVADAEVTLIALQREWFNVQVEEDGYTRWEWNVVETPVYTETTQMGADGRATLDFVPEEGGSYRLRAITTDDAGRTNQASAFLWVSSERYVSWRMENNDRIELVADRDSYSPGDVAEILIPSPYRGEVQALVTVERGRFFQQEVITLDSNSAIYRLPIVADYAPTIYVSVVLMKGIDETNLLSSFKMGEVQLNVSTEQQALNIELTPSSESFGPGDTVTYEVLVTDYDGAPVEAELSLALVDLSVLTLAPDPAAPILDAFYSKRGLGVQTGIGLVMNVNRLNEEVADQAKGGGGGGGDAAFGIGIEVRADFPDTAYWDAFVQTDASGRAEVEITLPDSLTTWRLSAKAITADTLVGQADVDILTSKPLMVQPVTPRFFVVGDRVRLGTVVHNNTDGDLDVDVSLAAQGVELDSPATQQVSIPAGGRVQVNWNVTVPDVENVGLIFSATGGGLTDASKPLLATGPDGTIPVLHYSSPDIVGTAGQLLDAGARTEGILLPPNVDTTQGTLQVEIAPSLAAAMQDGLDYLEHYPYECTEQTVSRFLPNVLTYKALQEFEMGDPDLEAHLVELVGEGLQRLYNQQHYDGGWGWWYTSESNSLVTAWVLLGLDKAAEAGFTVDTQVMQDAQDYLNNRLATPANLRSSREANRQAFVLYVLAERDATSVSRLETLYEVKDKLSHYGKAYLALAYGMLDGEDSAPLQTLLADISGEAILSATGAHWEEAEDDWWNWNTDTRSTAIILDLLARYDDQNDIAPNVVRWLMVARQAGHWETTQETAWALIALTDWMSATGELQADYGFDVAFNGQIVAEGEATAATIRESTDVEIAVWEMLVDQVNQLTIGRGEGPGRLYYTAHLESYLPVEEVESLGRGVIIAREYTAASCDPEETTCEPLTSIPVGEGVRVKLTIVAPHDLYYVLVEDPLPAGAEAVDPNLLTSSTADQAEGWSVADQQYQWGWWGWWWFNQTQVRDDKVVLFADYLPAGTYEYSYIMQASLPGEYRVIPATAREFYFPEVFGRTDGMLFEIEP